MTTIIEVDADALEVKACLKEILTQEQFTALKIAQPQSDPFAPQRNNDLPSFQTVVEFVVLAVAGGITYDVVKTAAGHLIERFGSQKVRKIDDDGDNGEKGGK